MATVEFLIEFQTKELTWLINDDQCNQSGASLMRG